MLHEYQTSEYSLLEINQMQILLQNLDSFEILQPNTAAIKFQIGNKHNIMQN